MKKYFYFLPLVAALTMTGCSSDESNFDREVNGGNGEASYLAVNVVTPNGIGTRAGTEGGFEDGISMENKAEKGTFLFFDAGGVQIQAPQTVDLTWKSDPSTNNNPQVEKISEAVLVIAGNTAPERVLVVLNAPAGANFSNKSMTEVRNLIENYDAQTEGTFIITNSTYEKDGKDACATDIAGKTYKSQDDAKMNAVNIYVERVLAKVTTSALSPDFAQGAEITVDGQPIKLKQEINGIEIANIADKSYLFKSIEGFAGWTTWANWNDVANFRSYWATSPNDLTYSNKSWSNITDAVDASHTYYIQENTANVQPTAVLVTATLKTDNGTPFAFVKWAGSYYAKDGFLKQYAQILTNAGYWVKKDATTYRTIEDADLDWLTKDEHKELVDAGAFKGYEMTAKVKNNTLEFFKKEGENYTPVPIDDMNTLLKEETNCCWIWEDGKCYYFVNIEHFGSEGFDVGIVRNHVYKLNLNSLSGVGVPVYNPDEVIIPEVPTDDLFYLAAQINILKWKIVEQTVDFK